MQHGLDSCKHANDFPRVPVKDVFNTLEQINAGLEG